MMEQKLNKYKHITMWFDGKNTHNGKPVYGIFNNKSEELLGTIYYEPDWKQYVMTLESNNIIMSVSCLQDVIDFIENQID